MKIPVLQVSLIMMLAMSVAAPALAQKTVNEPQSAVTFNDQGVRDINNGRYFAAVEALKRAINLRPDYSTAHYNLGVAWYFLGNREQALAEQHEAIKLAPQNSEPFNQLGVIYADTGNLEKALEAFKQSASLKPDNPTVLYNLACVYIRAKNFKEAIAPLARAVEIQPTNAEARVNLGFALKQLKRYREAIVQIRHAVLLNPADLESQFFLGTLALLVGDRETALAQFEVIRVASPQLGQQLFLAINKGKVVLASY